MRKFLFILLSTLSIKSNQAATQMDSHSDQERILANFTVEYKALHSKSQYHPTGLNLNRPFDTQPIYRVYKLPFSRVSVTSPGYTHPTATTASDLIATVAAILDLPNDAAGCLCVELSNKVYPYNSKTPIHYSDMNGATVVIRLLTMAEHIRQLIPSIP